MASDGRELIRWISANYLREVLAGISLSRSVRLFRSANVANNRATYVAHVGSECWVWAIEAST